MSTRTLGTEKSLQLKTITLGTLVAVQRSGLSASAAEGSGSGPGWRARSCMSHTAPKKPKPVGLNRLPQAQYMGWSSRSAAKVPRYFSAENLATSGSISIYKDELLLAFSVDSAKGVSWK